MDHGDNFMAMRTNVWNQKPKLTDLRNNNQPSENKGMQSSGFVDL